MTHRKTPLAMGLVAILLLAVAVPMAMAQGPGNTTGNPSGHGPNDAAGSHAMNETEREQRHSELEHARNASLDSFKENRTNAIKDFLALLASIRSSFMENKTKVLDDCKAAHNETTGNESATHCVRDGLKALIDKAHADIKDAQEGFRSAMEAARDHAKAGFASHRHDINAKHGQPDA